MVSYQKIEELAWNFLVPGGLALGSSAISTLHMESLFLVKSLWPPAQIGPWKAALKKVDEGVPQGLNIRSTRLTNILVPIDAHESQVALYIPPTFVWNMCTISPVCNAVSQIDAVYDVRLLSTATDDKVLRFDVAVNLVRGVKCLEAMDHLLRKSKNSRERHFSPTL